jgi:hypothetical protein
LFVSIVLKHSFDPYHPLEFSVEILKINIEMGRRFWVLQLVSKLSKV